MKRGKDEGVFKGEMKTREGKSCKEKRMRCRNKKIEERKNVKRKGTGG